MTLATKTRIATAIVIAACAATSLRSAAPPDLARFPLRTGGLQLERATRAGRFFDVIGRRAALFGYENQTFEAWVYPLEILEGFSLAFRPEGYPADIDGRDIMSSIEVRPEATTVVYTHAAFTVRQVMFAPIDESGAIVMLDVDSVLPLAITASFRPRLRVMWPAGSAPGSTSWDQEAHSYTIADGTGRYAGVIGSPAARDVSSVPPPDGRPDEKRFLVNLTPGEAATRRIPIVIAGGADGREAAQASYRRMVESVPALYEATARHYEQLDRDTLTITTPDERLNAAFRWAKIGIDKGVATNPLLGTGLVAGFRTAGETERPGFAWFFGRDALWTALATTAEGAFETTRAALDFLRRFQRADGKIPHEISQSASLVQWFDAYPYAWASADATPLYVIAHADYFRATGDRAFLDRAWPSIVAAYRFTAATDTDRNGLVENTGVGHGWVEGGALYPAHEEIYLQGLWIAASRGIAELAKVMNDSALAASATAAAERTRAAMEATYWNDREQFYDFATALPRDVRATAEPGPDRARRQARLDALRGARKIDEDTVLPAVPLWFHAAEDERAQQEIDHLGSAAMTTDWGARILSNRSALYDPLAYHYGSVWPLFTGWSAVAAYRYGRPHIGYQALVANALLTFTGALGDVTELLSGAFATEFESSSHHQVWSEAMVVAPTIRGLLGIDIDGGGRTVRFAPSLPASWNRVDVRGVAAGGVRLDLSYARTPGRIVLRIAPVDRGSAARGAGGVTRLIFAPALPLDARVQSVTVDGTPMRPRVLREGDVRIVEVTVPAGAAQMACAYTEGTDVYREIEEVEPGATSEGLRILRSRAESGALHLLVEGMAGRSYTVRVRSPHRLGSADGVVATRLTPMESRLEIRFDGPTGQYVRRQIAIPLLPIRGRP